MRDFKKQKKTFNKHENTRKETKFKEEGGGENKLLHAAEGPLTAGVSSRQHTSARLC